MQVNFTIFVQSINFLIAYFLMRRFLFRPTITILVSEEAHEAHLQAQLLDQRATIENLERKQQEEWRLYYDKIAQQIPVLEWYEKREKIGGIEGVHIPSAVQQRLVDQTARAITDGIRDVVH